jgi:hypothetical protein
MVRPFQHACSRPGTGRDPLTTASDMHTRLLAALASLVRMLAPHSGGIIRGVSRETAINDDGSMFTREPDHDLLQHDAAAADAIRALRPARAEVPSGRRPGYVALSGGASFADVSTAAS